MIHLKHEILLALNASTDELKNALLNNNQWSSGFYVKPASVCVVSLKNDGSRGKKTNLLPLLSNYLRGVLTGSKMDLTKTAAKAGF